MAKASKGDVTSVTDVPLVEDRSADLGGYTVDFVTIKQDHDLVQMLAELPGGRCPCPHWGYVLTGQISISYADHDEVINGGEAFYLPPGHIPAATAGTEIIQFSPTEQLQEVLAAMLKRAQHLQQA